MDRLHQLELFLAIQRHGSFAAAARALRISPAAASASVGDLERWLGAKVFERSTRHVAVTEAGKALGERAQAIVDLLADVRGAVSSEAGEVSGRLSISAPVGYGAARLGPTLIAFMQAHPGVHLMVDYSDRQVDLVAEQYQLAIRLGEVRDRRLTVHPLAPHRLVLCAAPRYLETAPALNSPNDLKNHRCLVYTRRLPTGRWVFVRGGRQVTIAVQSVLDANNGRLLVEAAVAGLGLTLAPDFLVERALANGDLQEVAWDWQGQEIPLQIVAPSGASMPRHVRALIDFLQALARRLPVT